MVIVIVVAKICCSLILSIRTGKKVAPVTAKNIKTIPNIVPFRFTVPSPLRCARNALFWALPIRWMQSLIWPQLNCQIDVNQAMKNVNRLSTSFFGSATSKELVIT